MVRNQNIENLKTEKKGISILRNLEKNFIVPTHEEKRHLYKLSDISFKKYSRSIDGVIIHTEIFDNILTTKDFTFVEIKTTSASNVTELPYGVFFGITKNEETLFKILDNFCLCLVHTKLKTHILLNFEEYESLIQNKRIQYQINFKSKM